MTSGSSVLCQSSGSPSLLALRSDDIIRLRPQAGKGLGWPEDGEGAVPYSCSLLIMKSVHPVCCITSQEARLLSGDLPHGSFPAWEPRGLTALRSRPRAVPSSTHLPLRHLLPHPDHFGLASSLQTFKRALKTSTSKCQLPGPSWPGPLIIPLPTESCCPGSSQGREPGVPVTPMHPYPPAHLEAVKRVGSISFPGFCSLLR